MAKKSVVVIPQTSRWDHAQGLLASALVFLTPFFPDEKLVRLKLQCLEYGVLALAALVGLRFFWDKMSRGQWNHMKADRYRLCVYGSVLLWFATHVVLGWTSPEPSLSNGELRRIYLAFGAFAAFGLYPLRGFWRMVFLSAWAISAGLLSVYGLLQITGGAAFVSVPQLDRAMSTYGNPIFFAAFLLTSLFVSWGTFSQSKSRWVRWFILTLLGFQLAALYYSKTRAAWIGFAAACFLLAAVKLHARRIPVWIWAGILLVGGTFVVQTRDIWMRDQAHLLIWRDTLKMFADKPLAGVGLGAFHTNFVQHAGDDLKKKWPQGEFIVNYAHNEYVQMLAEGGVIGFSTFAFAVGSFLMFLWKRRDELDSSIFIAGFGVIAALVQNFFSVDMRFSISFATAFLLMALVTVPDAAESGVQGQREPASGFPLYLKWAGSALLAVFLAGVLFPRMMKRYQAQKEVSRQKDFFDERLLDPAKTVADLEALAEQYPGEPSILERLAFVYAKEIKSRDGTLNREMAAKAAAVYRKLIAVQPGMLGAYNNLANIHYTLGNPEEAITYWTKAVTVNPQFLEGHLNLGKVLYVQGRLKESVGHFEKALKIDPHNSEALVYMRKMVE